MHSVLVSRLKAIDGEMVKPAAQKFSLDFAGFMIANTAARTSTIENFKAWGRIVKGLNLPETSGSTLVVLRAGKVAQILGRVKQGTCKQNSERPDVGQPPQHTSEFGQYNKLVLLFFVLYVFLFFFSSLCLGAP